MTLKKLYFRLEEWQRWHENSKAGEEMQLGYPKQSLVIMCGGASSVDEFDNMVDDIDLIIVGKVEAMVNDLPSPQKVAVHHVWLKTTKVWPTHEMDYSDALDRLMRLSEKRGLD